MGIKKKIKKLIYNHQIEKNFGHYKVEKKISVNWHKKFINRVALINACVANIFKEKKNCYYLEIGCDDNFVFNSIMLEEKYKTGVDPRSGGNKRTTSDLFFKNNKKKFDVIFIDGLHHYDQCQRDVINSIEALNRNGTIFIHDLIPLDWKSELVPRIQGHWSGDVWKVGYELSKIKNLNFKIVNVDSGVGFFKKKSKINYKKLTILKEQRFKDFLKIYKKLPLIEPEKALKKILND